MEEPANRPLQPQNLVAFIQTAGFHEGVQQATEEFKLDIGFLTRIEEDNTEHAAT